MSSISAQAAEAAVSPWTKSTEQFRLHLCMTVLNLLRAITHRKLNFIQELSKQTRTIIEEAQESDMLDGILEDDQDEDELNDDYGHELSLMRANDPWIMESDDVSAESHLPCGDAELVGCTYEDKLKIQAAMEFVQGQIREHATEVVESLDEQLYLQGGRHVKERGLDAPYLMRSISEIVKDTREKWTQFVGEFAKLGKITQEHHRQMTKILGKLPPHIRFHQYQAGNHGGGGGGGGSSGSDGEDDSDGEGGGNNQTPNGGSANLIDIDGGVDEVPPNAAGGGSNNNNHEEWWNELQGVLNPPQGNQNQTQPQPGSGGSSGGGSGSSSSASGGSGGSQTQSGSNDSSWVVVTEMVDEALGQSYPVAQQRALGRIWMCRESDGMYYAHLVGNADKFYSRRYEIAKDGVPGQMENVNLYINHVYDTDEGNKGQYIYCLDTRDVTRNILSIRDGKKYQIQRRVSQSDGELAFKCKEGGAEVVLVVHREKICEFREQKRPDNGQEVWVSKNMVRDTHNKRVYILAWDEANKQLIKDAPSKQHPIPFRVFEQDVTLIEMKSSDCEGGRVLYKCVDSDGSEFIIVKKAKFAKFLRQNVEIRKPDNSAYSVPQWVNFSAKGMGNQIFYMCADE